MASEPRPEVPSQPNTEPSKDLAADMQGLSLDSSPAPLLQWFYRSGASQDVQLGLLIRERGAVLQRHSIVGTVIAVKEECKSKFTVASNEAQQQMIDILLPHAQRAWTYDKQSFADAGLVSKQPPTGIQVKAAAEWPAGDSDDTIPSGFPLVPAVYPNSGVKSQLQGGLSSSLALRRWFFNGTSQEMRLGLQFCVDGNEEKLQRDHVVGTVIKVRHSCSSMALDPLCAEQQRMIDILLPHAQHWWQRTGRPGFHTIATSDEVSDAAAQLHQADTSEPHEIPPRHAGRSADDTYEETSTGQVSIEVDLTRRCSGDAFEAAGASNTTSESSVDLATALLQLHIDVPVPPDAKQILAALLTEIRTAKVRHLDANGGSGGDARASGASNNISARPLSTAAACMRSHGHDNATSDEVLDAAARLLEAGTVSPHEILQRRAAAGASNTTSAASVVHAQALLPLHSHVAVAPDAKLKLAALLTEIANLPPAEVAQLNANGGIGGDVSASGASNNRLARPLSSAAAWMRSHGHDDATSDEVSDAAAQLLEAGTVSPHEIFQRRAGRSSGDA